MKRNPFGSTGVTVPALASGCAPFTAATAAGNIAAACRAAELGMNYFDTAPTYAGGESQRVVGMALKQISEPVFVATKIGYLGDPARYRDVDAILAQVHNNLKSLGRDHVDLLQIHEPEWVGWWCDDESPDHPFALDRDIDFADAPVMHALHRARAQGLCRFIGIAGNTTTPPAHLLQHLDVDTVLTAYTYNLLQRNALKDLVPVAREKGVALISAGPLYFGRLAAPNRDWINERPDWMTPSIHARYPALCDLVEDCGIPMAELAIRYALSGAHFDTILNGYRAIDEVEHNVAAANAGPLPQELRERIDELSLQEFEIPSWLFELWQKLGNGSGMGDT